MFIPGEVGKVFDRMQRVQGLTFKLIDVNMQITLSRDA